MKQIGAEKWRLSEQMYKLVGEQCSDCSELIFPPRDVCPGCRTEVVGSNKKSAVGLYAQYRASMKRIS